MLDRLKQLFKRDPAPGSLHADGPHFDVDNPNFVTEPGKIVALLEQLIEAMPLCAINFDHIDEVFSSSLLEVNARAGYVILDEIVPAHGNHYALDQRQFKVTTQLKGIPLSFKLHDLDARSAQGIAYYQAPLPTRLYYPQRRQAPRLPIDPSLGLVVHGVIGDNNVPVIGSVMDLSRGGLNMILPEQRGRLQRGDRIRRCHLTLPNQVDLQFDLSVRFSKPAPQALRKRQVGAYFEHLAPSQQKKLDQFLAALEREEIRKRKEG